HWRCGRIGLEAPREPRGLARRGERGPNRGAARSGARPDQSLERLVRTRTGSSGRMGMALAAAARDRGAKVTLILGASSVDAPEGVMLARVATAAQMERAMLQACESADVVLKAAAVSDYRPQRASREKIRRGKGTMTIALEPNPDILARLGAAR